MAKHLTINALDRIRGFRRGEINLDAGTLAVPVLGQPSRSAFRLKSRSWFDAKAGKTFTRRPRVLEPARLGPVIEGTESLEDYSAMTDATSGIVQTPVCCVDRPEGGPAPAPAGWIRLNEESEPSAIFSQPEAPR